MTAPAGPAGALSGVVAGRTFFGALTSLRISLPDSNGSPTATMPSAEASRLMPGTAVSLCWDEDAPRLLAVERGRGVL